MKPELSREFQIFAEAVKRTSEEGRRAYLHGACGTDKLAAEDKQMAELVKLRFFVDLTNKEAAAILGVSEPTVERWWSFARAWLFREINAK